MAENFRVPNSDLGGFDPSGFEYLVEQNFRAVADAINGLLPSGIGALRLVRGTINGASGAVVEGTGWTAVRNGAGDYTVTYVDQFSATPTVTANSVQGSGAASFVSILSASATTARLQVVRRSDGAAIDENVHFHATGPR